MKYKEILSLYEYFLPVYVITEERKDYWKQFIPNEKFYNMLSTHLNAIESSSLPEKKNSIWLQGAYGTGKTHATAVVKHLLWDDLNDVSDFLERIGKVQLRERLKSFRERHKVFPVILKGVSNVTDIRTFALVIEKAVKDALKSQNIEISTKSDFEKMIYQVKENPAHIDWDKLIEESPDLRMYVNNKDDILDKLRTPNIKILRILESISSTKRIHFSLSNISEWLSEVMEELKRGDIADYLMIYWDEFTSVLEQERASSFLNELQNIAELKEKGIYVLVITHKIKDFPYLKNEEVAKVLDRFHYLDYSMEPITTYHIVEAAIKKVDREKWEQLKKEKLEENNELLNLINRLIGNGESNVGNSVKNLFPFHPYTAYLATFIARYIGSTERSIFKFLYDKEEGFLKFIEEHPTEGEDFYLTADYLWNFFVEAFERDNYEKFGSILDKHKLYVPKLEEKEAGIHYTSVFKGILLLNTLHQVVKVSEAESGLVSPSISNIHSMFLGTHHEKYVDEVLEFMDSREIIQKTPDNLFLVATSTLPAKEVESEKDKQKREYEEDITEILMLKQKEEVESILTHSVLRGTEVKLFWAGIKAHILRSKLNNAFKKDYFLKIGVFIGRTDREILQIKEILKSISIEDEFKNIIFVVVEDSLTEDAFYKFIEYKARAVVSERHNFKDERVTNDTYAEKVIDEWINKIKSGHVEWYLGKEEGTELASRFVDLINTDISSRIFRFGLETLVDVRRNKNIWKYPTKSKVSIETFLFADSRKDIEDKTSQGLVMYLRDIIKDNRGEYVISESLGIKSDADESHPVVKMSDDVKKEMESTKNEGVFHLGEALKFLSKPPYGLYTNMVNMAAMGFLMGQFVGRLYEAGTGRPLEKEIMRDKLLSLFKYWQEGKDSGKLEVRFGTEEEKELIDILKDVFKLQDVDSLTDARWKIREWVKEVKYPLWTFKISSNDMTKNGIEKIVWLIQSIDRDIYQKDISESLYSIKDVHYDLNLLINRENAKELFTKWLKDIENVNINDEEVESVVDFLNKNMQEEVVSWDEDKVREKVKDWKLRELEENEVDVEIGKELIDILKDVFKLQDVDSLNAVRWKIREWVKEVKYPLWTFKVSCDNDKTKKGVDKIVGLIQSIDREIDQKDISESLHSIKGIHYDLNLLINRENAKELFTKWLKTIENVNINDEEVESVVDFLNQNMQEEVVSWDEDKVRENVKDWQLRKLRDSEDKNTGEVPPQNGNGERVEKIKQKIQNYSGNIKEVFVKLIDEHPVLCRWLEKYLE